MAKILLDARMYGLEHTGVGRYVLRLVEELGKIDKKNKYALLLRKKYFDSLKLPDNWEKVLSDFRHYTVEEQLKLPEIVYKQNPDLVHFPHLNVPILFNGKFIVTLHDMTMHRQGTASTTLPLPLYLLKRIPYKLVFRHAVLSSKKIITPSLSVKHDLLENFGVDKEKVKAIHMGLDDNFYGKSKAKGVLKKYELSGDYFIYAGNAYPHKNVPRAIKATLLLNEKRGKKVQFVITGARNVFLKRLEYQIKKMGAEEVVKLLGFVSDEDLKMLYKNSKAFVYPSLSEGFGLQGLEAMVSGTLVLASNIDVFKEVYKNNAIYFDANNVMSIANKMEEVFNMESSERKKMIKNTQNFIKRYMWEKTAKETLQIYKEVLGS